MKQLNELKARIHLQTLISEKARSGLATATMKQIKQTAVRILRLAVDSELIPRNVFENVSIPKRSLKSVKLLTKHKSGW